jgi:hypothetical protein
MDTALDIAMDPQNAPLGNWKSEIGAYPVIHEFLTSLDEGHGMISHYGFTLSWVGAGTGVFEHVAIRKPL